MSHEIESTAWRRQVPWHGLGTKVADNLSPEQMLKAAQLDWEVNKVPMFTKANSQWNEVPEHYALVRDKDGRVLDVVGNRYEPVQNADAFEFFQEFIHAGDAEMDTAGSLHGGKWVWGLASLKEGFKLPNGDEVRGNVLVACPHKQGKSFVIRFTPVRVVCWNTLSQALRKGTKGEFRMGHRRKFDATARKDARAALGLAREQLDEFGANAHTLHRKRMDTIDVAQVLQPHFAPHFDGDLKQAIADGQLNPKFKAVMDAYMLAPGAEPGTAWGALNAVTYYFDHMAGKSSDTRLEKAWLGRNALAKDAILEELVRA